MPVVSKPLSVIQQTMWLEHRLAPASAAYNLVLAIRIRSPYDVGALERAVEAVGARHELLRTRFVELDGEPRRVPAGEPLARLEVQDVTAAGLRAAARAYVDRPFDLAEGAFRVGLLRLAPDDAVLLPVAHHIAGDFASHWLIVRDLLAAYGQGRLPEPSGDYDLFVDEEARVVASAVGARSRAYWAERIEGASAAELPADRPRPALSRHVGATRKVRLAADVAERLPGAAEAAGVTPFAYLLGTFAALVRRYSGRDDFLIGCPATNRMGRELREVVGAFVNPVPIRARFTPATTFRDAIVSAGAQIRTGMLHVRYPCGLLGGGAPLFRLAVLLVAMDRREPNIPNAAAGEDTGPTVEYGGLTVALMDVPSQEGQLDLVVRLEQSDAGIDMVCAYDSDLFDAATIDRFAEHYQRFVRAAVTDPDAVVADADLTGDDELAALLALGGVWNA
ncbi:condensation domain-containing protein [Actinoallomurus soli]|uniref:condensation domain-containing protein n=1 Tax=Actinoallomurus soli TaxID=2952535 RepID=UPI002092E929|nr:condensation domain-containing protein [Actinoallomurus soli]MCO5968353.1 condensation domain-containing protein [Actinoallomurus soli]